LLNTGPDMRYGHQPQGESMKYASRVKTIANAVLAIQRGKEIVAWDAPGLTQVQRRRNIERLIAEVEAAVNGR
jgi:hypothetical protein